MRFDVGQRVVTPSGEALVTQHTSDDVFTTRGRYRVHEVSAWVDVEALKDPEVLDDWLEGRLDPSRPGSDGVDLVDHRCACKCNRDGINCHVVMHVSKDGEVLFSTGHRRIATACRCADEGCECLS